MFGCVLPPAVVVFSRAKRPPKSIVSEHRSHRSLLRPSFFSSAMHPSEMIAVCTFSTEGKRKRWKTVVVVLLWKISYVTRPLRARRAALGKEEGKKAVRCKAGPSPSSSTESALPPERSAWGARQREKEKEEDGERRRREREAAKAAR